MPPKRRASAAPRARGRPRRNARSAYASTREDRVAAEGQVEGEEQPNGTEDEEQPTDAPEQGLSPEETLNQLQQEIVQAQAERNRLAQEAAANQRTIDASRQAAELRQQLALIQAEIQSLRLGTSATAEGHNATPTTVQQPGMMYAPRAQQPGVINIQPLTASFQGFTPLPRPADPKSPLSEGLQNAPWPPNYKPITLPKFNGKTDPRQFLMSFEAAIASAGGNDSVLAKSFVIAAEGDALAWYSMLKPSTIYSWENLRDKILANFKGFASESLTASDLFQCKQEQGEPLKEYFQKFVQLKAKAPEVPEEVAIEAASKGLRIGPFAAHLVREKPQTLDALYSEFEKYCKSDSDLRSRLKEQNQYRQQSQGQQSKQNQRDAQRQNW